MKRTVLPNRSPAWRQMLATWLAGSLLCLLAALATPAWANDDPPGRVGRVTQSQGQAWLFDAEAGEWIALQRNRPLTGGDRLSVDSASRVELRIGSTTVRLDGNTELEIRRLDDERIELQLLSGTAAFRVRSPEVAQEVELSTAEGRFLPRRAGHYRIDRRDDTSFASAWSGELRFESEDSVLNVPAGRRAEFWQEGAQRATHYSWSERAHDDFSDWVARVNREDDRSASARYVSQEMTGWEDLDRHGRWDSHAEYGALWVPTTVVAGWSPYRYGHWAWIRPWGWTWVDDAPWGFAPFHYGRWVMYGGSWCWAPGRRVARPVYAPALVAWVGGPNLNVSVRIGAQPAPLVGWVPLAPREAYVPHYTVSSVYVRGVNAGHRHLQPQPAVSAAPSGPVRYANQGVPGAVTVVQADVLARRQPVAPAVAHVDLSARNHLSNQPWQRNAAPPAPAIAAPASPGPAATQRRERIPQRQVLAPQVGTAAAAPPAPVAQPAAPVARPAAPAAEPQTLLQTGRALVQRRDEEAGNRNAPRRRESNPALPAPVQSQSQSQPQPQPQPQSQPQPQPQSQRVAPPHARPEHRLPSRQSVPAVREVQTAPAPAAREAQNVPVQRDEPEARVRAPEARSNRQRQQMQ